MDEENLKGQSFSSKMWATIRNIFKNPLPVQTRFNTTRLNLVRGKILNYHDIIDLLDKQLDDFNDILVKKTCESVCEKIKKEQEGKKLLELLGDMNVEYWEEYGVQMKKLNYKALVDGKNE